jgi:hypothetical protein
VPNEVQVARHVAEHVASAPPSEGARERVHRDLVDNLRDHGDTFRGDRVPGQPNLFFYRYHLLEAGRVYSYHFRIDDSQPGVLRVVWVEKQVTPWPGAS